MASAPPTGKTVVIIEDNDAERDRLSRVLGREGFAVVAEPDGGAALGLLRAGLAADVVVLDMMLHGLDGWHFLDERRRDPALADIPVVIVTALTAASPAWAQSLGAQGFIRKPVPVPALVDEVRRLCAARPRVGSSGGSGPSRP
jgi:CheY-like chemotaxis protein